MFFSLAYQSGLMGQAPQMGIPTSMMSPIPNIQNGTSPYSPAPPSSGPTVLLVANLDEEVQHPIIPSVQSQF